MLWLRLLIVAWRSVETLLRLRSLLGVNRHHRLNHIPAVVSLTSTVSRVRVRQTASQTNKNVQHDKWLHFVTDECSKRAIVWRQKMSFNPTRLYLLIVEKYKASVTKFSSINNSFVGNLIHFDSIKCFVMHFATAGGEKPTNARKERKWKRLDGEGKLP